jgi:hypothetical protein
MGTFGVGDHLAAKFRPSRANRLLPIDRDQPFLLPPDLGDWPEDDGAYFMVAAVERVRLRAFPTNPQPDEAPPQTGRPR